MQFAKSGPYTARYDGAEAEITHRTDPGHVITKIAVDNAESLQRDLDDWHNAVREHHR